MQHTVSVEPLSAGLASGSLDSFLFPHLLFFSATPEGAALLAAAPQPAAWLQRMQRRPSLRESAMRRAFEMFHHLPAKTLSVGEAA